MKNNCTIIYAVTALFCFSNARAHDFAQLSELIEKTKSETGLASGTAVAVVQDGQVIYEGYFGLADIEAKQPVSRDTAFYIASATKPFTALNALLQMRAGKLQAETSLQQLFPTIRFKGFDAKAVTVKNLLTHTSGLDNQAMVWATAFSGVHTAQSRRALVAASYPNPEVKLGAFQYSNVGYNILSVALEADMPWQKQLEKNIFQPLGMQHTSAYISQAHAKAWPLAKPYSYASATPGSALYLRKSDTTMQAAGGLISTATDLAKFLIVQLSLGQQQDKQVFPAALMAQSQTPQVKIDESYLDFARTGYAWGWYSGDFKGHSMRHHFGGFAGFHAHLSFIPEAKIGLVVLNNEDVLSPRLTNLIADYVYATLINEASVGQPRQQAHSKFTARFDKLVQEAKQARVAIAQSQAEIAARAWKLSKPLAAYVGSYSNALLGEIRVALNKDKKLTVHWGQLAAVASGFDVLDQVRVELVPGSGDLLQFVVKDEKVNAIRFADALFERK
jgi:CubicO group peptidase (beta-lactamase class C family)